MNILAIGIHPDDIEFGCGATLIKLAKKGHKVYIIAPKSKAEEEFSYPGVKVIRVSSIPAFYYKGYRLTSLFNESLFKYLKKDDSCFLEKEPLETLARDGELIVYQHEGFWQCVDTYRELEILNNMWKSSIRPWKVWE